MTTEIHMYTNLLQHQAEAVEKLRHLKVGALYMEMGTGKTRTALDLIKRRLDAGKVDRVLWLCPCSVKGDLLKELRKHTNLPDLPDILTVCGIETMSTSVRTCERLLALCQQYRIYLIVDESTLIKNHAALRSIHITQLAELCRYKLILNGTPVTKCEADLFAQWYLLDWRILGYRSFYSFAANHLEFDKDRPGKIVRALNVDYLSRKIAPYTYQCLKQDVFKLPSKTASTQTFCMTPEQDEQYEQVIVELMDNLDDMSDAAIYQFLGALQSVISGFEVSIEMDEHDHRHVRRTPMFKTPEDNPRICRLLDIVSEIQPEDKVLIFCTYTQEIRDVVDALNRAGAGEAIDFHGQIPKSKRQDRIERFRSSARFLVANKSCGAFGLNLQFCHRLIFYSHDWNWGTRAQAEDRLHRYGQQHPVEVINLEAIGTIDAQILRCLDRKERLSDRFKSEMDAQNLKEFLKGGPPHGKDLSPAKRVRGRAATA